MGQECISLSSPSWQIPLRTSDLWLYKFPCLSGGGLRQQLVVGIFIFQAWTTRLSEYNNTDRLHTIVQPAVYWLFCQPLSPGARRAGGADNLGARKCRCWGWGRPGGIHTGPAAAWRPCFFWVLIFLAWALTTLTGATWIPDTPETGKCNFIDDFNRMVLSDCFTKIDRPV